MGILGYPNMDDGNNHDGIFGDYSEVYANYSNEDNLEQGVNAQAGTEPQEVAQQRQEQAPSGSIPQVAPQAEKRGSGVFFMFVLALLAMAAAGVYLYKTYIATPATQEQSMGDYFYDQATNNATTQDVATVDVDLASATPTEVQKTENVTAAQPKVEKQAKNKEKVAEGDVKELTALEKAELKKKADAKKEEQLGLSTNPVIVPVSSGGRLDPFLPANQVKVVADTSKFELIAPPTIIPDVDPMVENLMQAKVTGIMFDSSRPSAIISVGGSDQLVHKGDSLSGYKVLNITKDTVVIQYNANVYNASVGQSIGDMVNVNPVSNLSKSFGGAYSKSSQNVIEIK